MEFRLTYAGPLYATQRDSRPGQPSRHMENKHDIRTIFHHQLRELWRVLPAFHDNGGASFFVDDHDVGFKEPARSIEELSAQFSLFGFNFVPLVTEELDLICSLDILFLRPDRPGKTIWAGDIDNRLKTLLDSLRIPEAAESYSARTPGKEEAPFFILLEDDKLVTRVSVETDRMLEPVSGGDSMSNVRIVISVKIAPYGMNVYNMHLG